MERPKVTFKDGLQGREEKAIAGDDVVDEDNLEGTPKPRREAPHSLTSIEEEDDTNTDGETTGTVPDFTSETPVLNGLLANNTDVTIKDPSHSKEERFVTYKRKPSVIDRITHPIASHRRASSVPKRARLISKGGSAFITNENITEKKSRFLVDIFTTLLDLKWRYLILVFFLAFHISWLSFAVIYFIICVLHGDHKHYEDPDWKPCHSNVYDFTTAFLFSLETQHTIGYGYRGMEPNCVPSMIALAAQSCTGAFFQCIVTGLVFAKLSRPKKRSQTITFSKKAVICKRDNKLSLVFRVGDMRQTHIIATSIRAILVKNRVTKEGELMPFCQYPLPLQTESGQEGDNYLFLMWPVTVYHTINSLSPLAHISADTLTKEHFEIIIILEGTVPTTGMTTQVRTSYMPSEVLWGHRLAPLLTYRKDTGAYKIDHGQFHETIPLEDMSSKGEDGKLTKEQNLSVKDYNCNFQISPH